ncbi:MAG: hypothetical protein LUI87_14215 [Lachnospiraceae bacterium]|nr:hypothetical protein [Lachnospiraceae bacterium]
MPDLVFVDVCEFTGRMESEEVDLKQLGIKGKTKKDILEELRTLYR